MRFKAPPCVVVVKREDKQEKLTQFLNSFLDRRGREGPLETFASLSLVARSADSPVAHALAGMGERLIGNGLAVRAIFATMGPQEVAMSWCAGGALPFDRDVRMMHNPRLLEAHELLVLGPRTCWIGDSMRRDPAKRDACPDNDADRNANGTANFRQRYACPQRDRYSCRDGDGDAD